MTNWSESMEQTYEFYKVDIGTWKDSNLLDDITSCNIERDFEADTLGSATIDCTKDKGEIYIRSYMIANQNGVKEKRPLGTYLVQTPSISFDGRNHNTSLDAYTPLVELKEAAPTIGYTVPKGSNIMDTAAALCEEHMRGPVIKTDDSTTLQLDFVANTDDTWFSFISDLMANAHYHFDLDEMGNTLFAPDQDTESLKPVWNYDDGNSSILLPEISFNRDLFGIPNVVEVIYSNDSNDSISTNCIAKRVVNDDPASPTSTVNRGREILYRETSPNVIGNPTEEEVQAYAERLLQSLSTLEYTITYSHAYNPVRVGDCVLINYKRANLVNIKAKVIKQSFACVTGCTVSETAVYTNKLWEVD